MNPVRPIRIKLASFYKGIQKSFDNCSIQGLIGRGSNGVNHRSKHYRFGRLTMYRALSVPLDKGGTHLLFPLNKGGLRGLFFSLLISFLVLTSACAPIQKSTGAPILKLDAGWQAESQAFAESADAPILKLDTDGHMAKIGNIIAMGDGKRIISASNDKTIRIWDTSTGQETAKILGQIGGGIEGQIYAIALIPDRNIQGQSPDESRYDSQPRWLAVGGYLDKYLEYIGAIRIYDLKTGAIIKVLKSHENAVLDLSVSKDGRYLVSGSADNTVKVWDIADNFNLTHTFKGHTNDVYAVRVFKSWGDYNPLTPFDKGDYKIVSVGLDNKAILWSLRDKRDLNSYTHTNKLQYLAVSEEYIAVSGPQGNKINIFDLNLKHIKEIESETNPSGLSFSPDGRLLLAGVGAPPPVCNIYACPVMSVNGNSQGGFRKITAFNKHDNLTMAVTFLNNRTAVTGGGNNADIYIWDAYTGEVKRQITGNGKRVWSVGIRGLPSNASIGGREIAFGNIGMTYTNEQARLEKSINLETYSVSKLDSSPSAQNDTAGSDGFKSETRLYERIGTVYQGYSLTHAPGGDYGYKDAVLLIKENGNVTARITRDITDGLEHFTYGFTGEGTILSGGADGFLTAYNRQGQKTASFIGHTGEVWGIAIAGDTLVSGGSDQTIKLWNLKELKNLKPPSIDYELLKKETEKAERQTGKKWTIEDVKNYLNSKGQSSVYMKIPEIKPIVSIFISGEDEWVVWNEQGFYNASTKGDQYVGWHVNKGPENSADYYSARQFRRYLYRPDIIKKTIELGSSSLAIEELAKKEPGIKDITVAELIKRAPVDVKIASVDIAKDGKADVKVRLGKNTTTAPERLTLYINGAQALTETERTLKGAKPGDILKYTVNLPESKNHIKVTVENQWAENSHETTVDNPTSTDRVSTKGTTLYAVAVGISHYPELPLQQQLNSPPLDARAIAARLQKLEGTLYKKVDIKILTDDKNTVITSDMVEKALREQTQKAGALDTTIIFIAGHGVTDAQGSYHLVTADTKIPTAWGEQLDLKQGTSLDWKRLHSILDKTMGRRVVIVDTCQAGEVFSDNKTDLKRLVKDIHDVNAIVYSGTSRQDAGVEISKGGVFTLSMVSGFDGKASYDGNILPFIRLRDYVDKEVPRLNREIMLGLYRGVKIKQKREEEVNFDGVQKPMAVIPNGMERFIIYAK